ncbi:MAG TPA: MerR family transcriptional regulator [Motilibacteraceae bacterium]|nr:MerR family transcriptional regulator [Motilibacteraceae bacterium]
MEEDRTQALLSIGDLARASGLPVSALRFYDAEGVLAPVDVDPRTGYRRYAPEQVRAARVVAHLRRIGMPLTDVAELLGAAFGPEPDRSVADGVLDRHVRRLQDGLADALAESSRVRTLLDEETSVTQTHPQTSTVHVRPSDLAAAIDATRYALSPTPSAPVLSGALLELDGAVLRLVATDRYRLAVGEAPLRAPLQGDSGAGLVQVLVPTPALDELRARLHARTGEADVEVGVVDAAHGGGRVRVSIEGQELLESDGVEAEFPAYRRLLPTRQRHQVSVDVAALRQAVAAAPGERREREQDGAEYELVVLWVGEDGVQVGPTGTGTELAVNREFLLEALDAPGHGQLVLGLDDPHTPLALRLPAAERPAALLMPVRRD